MRNTQKTAMIVALLYTSLSVSVVAKDMDHGAHQVDHSAHTGKMIREVSVDGYKFAYHLIDIKEQVQDMPGMKEMAMTHHLMVYIQSLQGRPIDSATVGYLIKEPDGTSQKAMTMGMSGGFGADIKLNTKGAYTIKTKAVAEGKTLIDEFEYSVK